jgi:hypothetical protein
LSVGVLSLSQMGQPLDGKLIPVSQAVRTTWAIDLDVPESVRVSGWVDECYGPMVSASQISVIEVTYPKSWPCYLCPSSVEEMGMARASLMIAIGKLAIAGEQAGFTIEQMIDLLNSGLPVETLLQLIAWRLEDSKSPLPFINSFPIGSVPTRSGRA